MQQPFFKYEVTKIKYRRTSLASLISIPNNVFERLKRPFRTFGQEKYSNAYSCRIQNQETYNTMLEFLKEHNEMEWIDNKRMEKKE